MININLTFEDKEGKQLQNLKEEAKINGKAENWEDFILKLANVRGLKNGN